MSGNWKLVPPQPTEAMVLAALGRNGPVEATYEAMLNAAPAPTGAQASASIPDAALDAILLTYAWDGDANLMLGHAAIHADEREKLRALIADAYAAAGNDNTKGNKHG